MPIESAFASINKEDLGLDALLNRWIPLKNRPGTRVFPPDPPYFGKIEWDWRNKMWMRMVTDPALQNKVQQGWLPLFKMAPPFGGPGLDALLGNIKADLDKIEARGGRVIFVRCPSTGELREIEKSMWPRVDFWNRLLTQTGVPGIYFEDYPELSGFTCPEWSHLSAADAVIFTDALIPIVQAKLAGAQP